MEIILKETIDTLGEEGDIVKVKPGYARNFLIPRSKAVIANKANRTLLEQEFNVINARKERNRGESDALSKKLAAATVVIEQRVGEENKLYGSVTAADIADKLAEQNVTIDKRKIMLEEPIKTLGETSVNIKIGYQMTAAVKVNIVPLSADEKD